MQIKTIGQVHNAWETASPSDIDRMKAEVSYIRIDKEFADGLFKIEKYSHLNVLFYFHKSSGYELQLITRSGEFRGVFASCAPRRPSLIGLTTVKLIEREGNVLKVTGLDALNGTPVLDIKPFIALP